jgi:hypothetical protein
MKSLLKPTAVITALLLASLTAEAGPAPASPLIPAAPAQAAALPPAPGVVSVRQPLSAAELAKYRQKDAQCRTNETAGASDATTWWIVGGVVVVVAVVAIAAGGGHSGSGGGY